MMLMQYICDQVSTKGCLDTEDRIRIRFHTAQTSKEEARRILQVIMHLFINPESVTEWNRDFKRKMMDTLEYGSIVDDLCDRLRSTDVKELESEWSTSDNFRARDRLQHLERMEEFRLYRLLRAKVIQRCKIYFDGGILQASYPEVNWDDCSKYMDNFWTKFQPNKMPSDLRYAFVYATRNVLNCRDQNNEWINHKVRRQARWWRGRRPLPHSV